MKKYNHSLDFTVLALASAADGDFATAGKLLVKASKSHDVKDAVAILEASNAQAFERQVKASKAATSTKAAKRVKASTQVRAFDIGDEDEINELIEDDVDGDDEVEEVEEVDAAEDDEDDEDEGDFDTAFASMLKGMKGSSKR